MGRKAGYKHSKKTIAKIRASKTLTPQEEKLYGRNPNRFVPPKKWLTFEEAGGTMVCGSMWQEPPRGKPYDIFKDQQEAWEWWQVNKEKFMKEQEGLPAGHRPNIFWELEFGISYPENEIQHLLLANHNLWRPGEREKLLEEGIVYHDPVFDGNGHISDYIARKVYEIPESETTDGEFGMVCIYHPYDYPIVFPEEPGVRISPWQRCSCGQRFKKGNVQDIPLFPDTPYLDDDEEVVAEVNQEKEAGDTNV
jgi:hypothetical protein